MVLFSHSRFTFLNYFVSFASFFQWNRMKFSKFENLVKTKFDIGKKKKYFILLSANGN